MKAFLAPTLLKIVLTIVFLVLSVFYFSSSGLLILIPVALITTAIAPIISPDVRGPFNALQVSFIIFILLLSSCGYLLSCLLLKIKVKRKTLSAFSKSLVKELSEMFKK